MAGKNVAEDTNISTSVAAFNAETPEEFTSWLDDEANYVDRKINGKQTKVRRTCSVSANVPDDVYYEFVQLAAGDKTELDDGALTYLVRQAVWDAIGRTGYDEWAKAEATRIQEERSARMKGTATERAAKVKGLESELESTQRELAELKAMLAKMQANS